MDAFEEMVALFPAKYRFHFSSIRQQYKAKIVELRLRANRIPTVHTSEKSMPLLPVDSGWTVSQQDILDILAHLSCYSLNRSEHTLYKGYLTIQNGHRVGVGGTYVSEGHIDIASINTINIRIAREHPGCAYRLIPYVAGENAVDSLLIAGPPLSGKTTILRDLGKSLSDEPYYYKTVMIDERGEFAGVCEGKPTRSVGLCCDVLDGYPRRLGFEVALRTLSPDIILCDEIGSEDYRILQDAAKCGVALIASVHAQSKEDLLTREIIKKCLDSGVFRSIALVNRMPNIGQIQEVIKVK